MKTLLSFLLLGLLTSGFVHAADNTKGKKSDGKKNAASTDAPSGKEETLVGMMSVKPTGAAADIVGVIIAKRGGEGEKAYKVSATDDLAKQIDALRKNGTRVKLTGVVTDDVIKVTKAEDGGVKKKK